MLNLPHRTNARIDLEDAAITDLARSLQSVGQLHPITVRAAGTRYDLIAGHRRALAALQLAWTTIDAHILPLDDAQAANVRLAENAMREPLTPIDEALQLHDLVNSHPAGVDGVAVALGRSPNWIQDRLDLLTMPDQLQRAIHTGAISIAAAKRLARIHPDDLRDRRISDAVNHGINARTAALWLQDSQQSQAPQAPAPGPPLQTGPAPYRTDTQALCTLCAEYHDITATTTIRICQTCHTTLAQLLPHKPQPPAP